MEREIRRIIAVSHEETLPAELFSIRACHKDRVCLSPGIDVVIIVPVLQLHVTGIVQIHLSVLKIRASRVNAAAVKGLIRIERHPLIFPVDHISARIMPPQLCSALRIKRGILEKRMEHAVRLAQTVRIIEPARGRHQMKFLTEAALHSCCFLCRSSQFFQIIRQCTHNTISCLLQPGRSDFSARAVSFCFIYFAISMILPPALISPGSAFSTLPN